jgi:glycosyltransferase involved in cell wall biosynthesis
MGPLVSILIPCYNARPWIAQCIQSAIDQTYPHKEIVVVDDGSTDGSLDVIRDFTDRIRSDDVCPSVNGVAFKTFGFRIAESIVSLHYAYDKAIYGFSRGTYLHRRE